MLGFATVDSSLTAIYGREATAVEVRTVTNQSVFITSNIFSTPSGGRVA